MKQKHSVFGQSGLWVKLVAVLVAVGIVVVLIFGGVQSILSQITDLQRDLDAKTAEFRLASDQLAEVTGELAVAKSELAETATKLEMATIVVAESHIELYAFNWAQQIAACILKESKNLSAYLIEGNRQITSADSIRHSDYQAFILTIKARRRVPCGNTACKTESIRTCSMLGGIAPLHGQRARSNWMEQRR